MNETWCSGLVHWDDPEGWDGEGGGRGFRMGNTCTPTVDSCQCMAKPLQYCKVISLKKIFKNHDITTTLSGFYALITLNLML